MGGKNVNKENIKGFISKRRTDIIVIASLLLLSLMVSLFVLVFRKEGARVEVMIEGKVVATYPLSVNATYELNSGTNAIVIENGAVYMTYSDCPDHKCEKMGKKKYIGQSISCLPNRLSVKITGASDDALDFELY